MPTDEQAGQGVPGDLDAPFEPRAVDAGRSACGDDSAATEIVSAELVAPPPTAKPRIWTALTVVIGAIVAGLVVAGVVLAAAAIADAGLDVLRDGSLPGWMERYSQTRVGLLVLVLPGQMVFLAFVIGAAMLSPQPIATRLALRRGPLPLWTWGVFLLATPVVSIVSSQMLSWLVDEPSEHLKMVEQMIRAHADHFLIGLIVIVAVVPALVEELMFRGYLQSRLADRWSAPVAILFSAVLFSAAHLDPTHMVGVLPLGLWLGAIAWRADSVLPAMLCHATNNVIAVLGAKYDQAPTVGTALDLTTIAALAVGVPALLLSLYLVRSR